MTITQSLCCPYDVVRCIYDFHAENEKQHTRIDALVFTERLRLKIEERLMFGLNLDNLTFIVDGETVLGNYTPKIQFSVYLSQNGTSLPVILHTLHQPAWLVG